MGWSFRRSINLGPLRVNLSKSGVGYSVGGRGFRVGQDARGRRYRSVSIPNTGIYRRDYQPQAQPAPNPAIGSVNPVGGQPSGRIQWPIYVAGGALLYGLLRFIFAVI
jgi:hypothetical protein